MIMLKELKLEDIYLKVLSKTVIINRNYFYDQAIDADVKRFEKIRKLLTGLVEDYTTGCLLDYDYIKNHCRLKAVDLSRQKKLILTSKQFSK